MPTFRLSGNVSRELLDETTQPIAGARVWHVVNNCCADAPKANRGTARTNGQGEYNTAFDGDGINHYVRCDVPDAVQATARFQGVWVTFGAEGSAGANFVFQEQEAAAHPCGAACSTKRTPCKRETTNKEHCYQHKSQDTVAV